MVIFTRAGLTTERLPLRPSSLVQGAGLEKNQKALLRSARMPGKSRLPECQPSLLPSGH